MSEHEHNKTGEIVQGDLTVSGSSEIHIALDRCPDDLEVEFGDEGTHIPCNPAKMDDLQYDVYMHDRQTELFLKWNVSGTRKIVWKLFYR